MNRAELIDTVSKDLFAYVMHGSIPEEHVASQIKPEGLDERFEDFEALVDLHFVLRPAVVDFVEALPQRVRSIKTQTKNVTTASRGGINGRINWESTLTTRASSAPGDRSLFVCDTRHESYDIDENVVLKRLLSLIYTTLDDAEFYLQQEYDWITDRWQENLELVDQMRELFERNVHVTRIREPAAYEPTDRMLQRAETARNKIYRDAAFLLREHRSARGGDVAALRSLLEETTITPDDEETLFELYVLFQYVKAIEDHQDGDATVATIQTDRQEVARIESEDGVDVVLYHDNSAADRNLSFKPWPTEKDNSDLTRSELIKIESQRVLEQYFLERDFEQQTNRPDVIVLEIRHDDTYEYLVTEVKNSTTSQTIREGVQETLEYVAFLRKNEELVFSDSPFGTGWNGILIVQDLADEETQPVHDQEMVRILQASQLDDHLPTIIEKVL